jgi:hypothetical protein
MVAWIEMKSLVISLPLFSYDCTAKQNNAALNRKKNEQVRIYLQAAFELNAKAESSQEQRFANAGNSLNDWFADTGLDACVFKWFANCLDR